MKWLKNKIIWILIATGIIGIALASGMGGNGEPPITPYVMFNGQKIEFSYTDDNTGENLIIRTDKQTYGGWDSAEMYVMVENISSENQETKIKLLFNGSESLLDIYRLEKDISYQVEVPDYATTSIDCSYYENGSSTFVKKTCETEIKTGSHIETRYKDEWQKLEDINNEAEFTLPKNKIAYFKTIIQIPHQSQGEFFIEVVGDKGGHGFLK